MTTNRLIAFGFVLLLYGNSLGVAGDLKKKVLIIGIDGCRPDALLNADAPNLKRLIAEGAFTDQAQTGAVTVSGPSWSSMLTGVVPAKHGVVDNTFVGSKFDRYPHFFKRLKQVRPDLRAWSVVHWAPIHEKIVLGAGTSVAVKSDAIVSGMAILNLKRPDLDVLFLHYEDVDGAGHAKGYGPKVSTYLEAIHNVDSQVGHVLDAVIARSSYDQEDWLILVSTDHGGTDRGHGKDIPEHRTIFLIAAGPSVKPGRIMGEVDIYDIPATVAAHLGLPVDPQWGWDGRPVGLKNHVKD